MKLKLRRASFIRIGRLARGPGIRTSRVTAAFPQYQGTTMPELEGIIGAAPGENGACLAHRRLVRIVLDANALRSRSLEIEEKKSIPSQERVPRNRRLGFYS